MILSIGIIISCVLLITAVLMQNSKGGLQSQNIKSIVGVKKSQPLIEKATWALAILVMLFSMLS
jgi:preprotein translocase subunit SecG